MGVGWLLGWLIALSVVSCSPDINIGISSPVEGTTYFYSRDGGEVVASFDVELLGGMWSEQVQQQPYAFELCFSWSIEKNFPITCRPLIESPVHGIEFPNLKILPNVFGRHIFMAFLREISGRSFFSF
jgi:hypothetical protein